LRPILAAIGPLLADIQTGTGLTSPQVSLLTSLPILVMGVFALASGRLQRLIGEPRGIALGLAIIALASAARWFFNGAMGLIITAALGGIGIALIQALMPSYLKSNHPTQAGRLMGLFTTGIMAGAAITAASAAPLSELYGWPSVLAIACIPALIGLYVWVRRANSKFVVCVRASRLA
jgi:CP family cyanate transporter-like MFS transporter